MEIYMLSDGSYVGCDGPSSSVCEESLGGEQIDTGADYKTVELAWRIVRINEDGSIKTIYQGPNIEHNETSGFSYYEDYDRLVLVENSLSLDTGFCYDDSIYKEDISCEDNGGWCFSNLQYGAYNRLINNKSPQFLCATSKNKIKIGDISADEVAYAGGVSSKENTSYYLYTGHGCMTATKTHQDEGITGDQEIFLVDSDGSLIDRYLESIGDASWYSLFVTDRKRPVINLKANTIITGGNGTSTNPYLVKTN